MTSLAWTVRELPVVAAQSGVEVVETRLRHNGSVTRYWAAGEPDPIIAALSEFKSVLVLGAKPLIEAVSGTQPEESADWVGPWVAAVVDVPMDRLLVDTLWAGRPSVRPLNDKLCLVWLNKDSSRAALAQMIALALDSGAIEARMSLPYLMEFAPFKYEITQTFRAKDGAQHIQVDVTRPSLW